MTVKPGITIIIKIGSLSTTPVLANIISTKWRIGMENGKKVWKHWAFVFIAGRGFEWIPESYFVAYAA